MLVHWAVVLGVRWLRRVHAMTRRCTCPYLPPGHTPRACRWHLEAIAFGASQLSRGRRNPDDPGREQHTAIWQRWVDERLEHFEGATS